MSSLAALERKSQMVDALHRFMASLTHFDDLDDILWDVANGAVAHLGLEDCVIYLVDDDRTQLSVRGGIEVIHENRINADDERFPAAGWGVALKRQVSFADAEIFHDQQGFWNLDDSDQMNLRSRTGIRFPVRGGIIASLQLDLDWERTPVDGRRSTDSTWLLGLGYAW